uniref:Uncharacterized protein n=1 Tax=Arundo donax TaxID=35708 RepID=A0A0A9DWR8_ARUDO
MIPSQRSCSDSDCRDLLAAAARECERVGSRQRTLAAGPTCRMPRKRTKMPRPRCAGMSAWILLYSATPATTPARPMMNPTNWTPTWR